MERKLKKKKTTHVINVIISIFGYVTARAKKFYFIEVAVEVGHHFWKIKLWHRGAQIETKLSACSGSGAALHFCHTQVW